MVVNQKLWKKNKIWTEKNIAMKKNWICLSAHLIEYVEIFTGIIIAVFTYVKREIMVRVYVHSISAWIVNFPDINKLFASTQGNLIQCLLSFRESLDGTFSYIHIVSGFIYFPTQIFDTCTFTNLKDYMVYT